MTNKTATILAVLALVISLVTGWFTVGPKDIGFSATTGMHIEDYLPYVRSNGGIYTELPIRVGASGTDVSQLIKGNCALTVQGGTITASTSAPFDCPVTGVVSGDTVFGNFATTTGLSINTAWAVEGVKASTTAGFITFTLRNNTGAAANPSTAGLASSTNYLVLH